MVDRLRPLQNAPFCPISASGSNFDKIVKSLQGRHSAKLVLDSDRGAGVHKQLNFLDSRFHGNDNNGCFLTFYEIINFNPRNIQYIPAVKIIAFLDLDQN